MLLVVVTGVGVLTHLPVVREVVRAVIKAPYQAQVIKEDMTPLRDMRVDKEYMAVVIIRAVAGAVRQQLGYLPQMLAQMPVTVAQVLLIV